MVDIIVWILAMTTAKKQCFFFSSIFQFEQNEKPSKDVLKRKTLVFFFRNKYYIIKTRFKQCIPIYNF